MEKQKSVLKQYFLNGLRPDENDFEDLIDSGLNKIDDKFLETDPDFGIDDEKYVTSKMAKKAAEDFAPVQTVNNISPDSGGNVAVTNITGTAGTITGNITKSQVTGLQSDLDSKQATLVSGTNIRTINGQSLIGNTDLTIATSGITRLIGLPSAAFTLQNITGSQMAFPATCDTFTLDANKTYLFKGKYLLETGTTAHSTFIGWDLGGSFSYTTMEYTARAYTAILNTVQPSSNSVQISGHTGKTLTSSSSTQPTTTIEFDGILRTNVGGTISPVVGFNVAAPGGTNKMRLGSYVEFIEIGSNTVEAVGNVG